MNNLEVLKSINLWQSPLKKPQGKIRKKYVDWLVDQKDDANISAVLGVRRAGKSTILTHLLYELIKVHGVSEKNTLYINLEDPRLTELLRDSALIDFVSYFVSGIANNDRVFVVLDEVQNIDNWEAVMRTLQDIFPQVKWYVTGSSANLLSRELGTKLVGRYIKNEVFPFSYLEYKKLIKKPLMEYVLHGGFPNPVLSPNPTIFEQLLRDYYESILLRDIIARFDIRNELRLRRLVTHLYTNISNQASSYRLSKDLQISPDTVLQYFSHIQDAYLGFFVPKYSFSVRKQEYNPKKFYAIDTGLQSAIAFRVLDDVGKLFENTVFLELRRHTDQIFYWQEQSEVDFVVKREKKW